MSTRHPSTEPTVGIACPYPAWHPPVKVPLTVLPEHPCSYLPERTAQSRGFLAHRISAGLYHQLMNAGFRRSGQLIYQPICGGCRACLPIRVPVEMFRPSKSQRRCVRRNDDLMMKYGPPQATDEKYELYRKYLAVWHSREDSDRVGFESFLYESPVDTLEFEYRDGGGRLLAVGICDVYKESLSSVYFYFDPDESDRGLGTFGALSEIDFALKNKIPYYYLGYWIDQCPAMRYKATYRCHEILHPDNVWRMGESG